MNRTRRRSLIAMAISIGAVALAAPASHAAVTIGSLDPQPNLGFVGCTPGQLYAQEETDAGSGITYDAGLGSPIVITSWATRARAAAGQQAALKVMSRDAQDPNNQNIVTYSVLHTSEVQNLNPGALNQFSVRIPAPGGGTVGYQVPSGSVNNKCFFDPTSGANNNPSDRVVDGTTAGDVGTTYNTSTGRTEARLNLQVTFEADADADGWGDETQDRCPGVAGDLNGCPPPAAPVLPPPPPPDVTKPTLAGLKFTRSSFAAAGSGAPFAAQKKKGKKKSSAPVGTKVSFTLSEVGSVTFTVERKSTGRRVSGKCKTKTRKNRKKPSCPLYKKVSGSFTVPGKAGANTFTFRGRIGGKALKTGEYRLNGIATDAARNVSAKPTQKSFKIVK